MAGDFLDAALLFGFGSSRYYLGNRYHAEQTVEEYNNRLNREQAARVLAILLRDTGVSAYSLALGEGHGKLAVHLRGLNEKQEMAGILQVLDEVRRSESEQPCSWFSD